MTVEEALERAVELGEVGIQVAAYLDGELIVDACRGHADADRQLPVSRDTLFPVFSVTKAYAVAAVHVLAERGLLAYDAPVARYWPEFGAAGKDGIRIADVLVHRSGVPHLPPGTGAAQMADWDWMVDGLARLEPLHAPGAKSSYQARSMGWILGELVQRVDPEQRPFARFLREELLDPLGIEDTWIGLPAQQEPRLTALWGAYSGPTPAAAAPGRGAAYGALTAPDIYASRALRAACLPSSGAITTARSAARFWALFAGRGELDGVRLFSESRVWSWLRPRAFALEYDEVLGQRPHIGVGGFWLGCDPIGEAPDVLCQPGAGGSLGWAELDRRLAVAICHNRMTTVDPADEHPHAALVQAIRELASSPSLTSHGGLR